MLFPKLLARDLTTFCTWELKFLGTSPYFPSTQNSFFASFSELKWLEIASNGKSSSPVLIYFPLKLLRMLLLLEQVFQDRLCFLRLSELGSVQPNMDFCSLIDGGLKIVCFFWRFFFFEF